MTRSLALFSLFLQWCGHLVSAMMWSSRWPHHCRKKERKLPMIGWFIKSKPQSIYYRSGSVTFPLTNDSNTNKWKLRSLGKCAKCVNRWAQSGQHMMTPSNGNISALLALCAGNSLVTAEFLSQSPETRSFDIFFHLRLNKRLSKQS